MTREEARMFDALAAKRKSNPPTVGEGPEALGSSATPIPGQRADGLVVVPREPTREMLDALVGYVVDDDEMDGWVIGYRAMIAATQQPAGEGEDDLTLEQVEETIIHNLRIRGMRSHDVPAVQDVFAALDEWKGIADREFANRTQAREEATKYRHQLGELLAVIHRDGGHRVEEVGLDQATAEAMQAAALSATQQPVCEGVGE